MSSNIDSMTEEERRAFRAYVVPDPVCLKKQGQQDLSVSLGMRRSLEENDTFVIRGAGRLESSSYKATKQGKAFRDAKKFNIAILDIPVLSSRGNSSNELLRYIMSDILLQLQACMDQGKTEYLHDKLTESFRAAKEKGIRFGRKPKERPTAFLASIRAKWEAGEFSGREAARQLGISYSTFRRWIKEQDADGRV